MKKIKNIWENNKIAFVLVCVLAVCFIAIVIVASTFFLAGNKSLYGDRLNDIDNHKISNEVVDSYKDKVSDSDIVTDVSFKTSGRVIYIKISFKSNTNLDEAKSVASKSVDYLDEEILNYYDVDFILESASSDDSDGFTLMGAKNVASSNVSFNNHNTKKESDK